MSRYYDPVTHRFINADGYFQSGGNVLDCNMSAYCRNNPISFVDPTGTKCSTHDPYFVPNCFDCNHDYFIFMKSDKGIEFYNRVTGGNLKKITDNGIYIYEQATNNSNSFIDYNVQYVVFEDNRNNSDNPSIKIINSFAITECNDRKLIIEALQSYNMTNPSFPNKWNRTTESLINEWDAHNFAYNTLPFTQSHTQDVDLDNNDGYGFSAILYALFQ